MFLRASRRHHRSSGSNTANRNNKVTQHLSTSIAFIPKANASSSIVSKSSDNNVSSTNSTSKKSSLTKVANSSSDSNNDTSMLNHINSEQPLLPDSRQSVDDCIQLVKNTTDLSNVTELSSEPTERISVLSPSPSPEVCRVEERLKIIKRSRVSQTDSAQRESTKATTTEHDTQPMYSTYPVFSHKPQTSEDELLVQTMVQECLDTLFFNSKTSLT